MTVDLAARISTVALAFAAVLMSWSATVDIPAQSVDAVEVRI